MNQAQDRDLAKKALAQMLLDQGDEETWEQLYDLRNVGVRLYAERRDPTADYYLTWNGVDWELHEGAIPVATAQARHWWRSVRIRARRYGVALPPTVPEKALSRWESGMASGWYVQHHLCKDLELEFDPPTIPTLDEHTASRDHCPSHHEPADREAGGCPVSGCGYNRETREEAA